MSLSILVFYFNFQTTPLVTSFLSKNRGANHDLVEFPGHNIYQNHRKNTTYNRISSEQMDIAMKKFTIKILLMAIGGYSCILTTFYASFWIGNKTTTTAVKFPFVEEKTNAEFHLNLMLQFIILFHTTFICFGIEVTMNLFENFTAVSPKLIHLKFTESIDLYERKETSELQLRFAFKNALVQCLDYDRYFIPNKSIDCH